MKGQSEAIGIAIIMAILAVSVVVFFVFSDNDTEDPRRESGLIMLDYLGQTFLQSDVQYGGPINTCRITLYRLIDDVYARSVTELRCGTNPPEDAEDILNDYMNSIITNLLNDMGYDYRIIIKDQDGAEKRPPWTSGDCSNRVLGARNYPLASSHRLEIALC